MTFGPVSVSDILKILDQVPGWKTIRALPGRVEALEARIAALEAALEKPAKAPGESCPTCGERALRRASSRPMGGELGQLGGRIETWACAECGATDERTKLPGG